MRNRANGGFSFPRGSTASCFVLDRIQNKWLPFVGEKGCAKRSIQYFGCREGFGDPHSHPRDRIFPSLAFASFFKFVPWSDSIAISWIHAGRYAVFLTYNIW